MYIKDKLEKLSNYYSFNPKIAKVGDFLKKHDLKEIEIGKYDLGDGCYVSVSEYFPKEKADDIFEIHKKYLDIQVAIEGAEIICCSEDGSAQMLKEYDAAQDYALYRCDNSKDVLLEEGVFVILDTKEYHKPSVRTEKSVKVKKAVFKILSN